MTAEEISHAIASTMQWPYEDVLRRVQAEEAHPGLSVREAWVASSPATPQEIELFYQTTDAYIFDLMVETHRDVRASWREGILDALRHQFDYGTRSVKVLDYGGGVGTDAMFWARRGCDVDYYDLPGVTSAFASARFRQNRLPIRVVPALEGPYDAIVSLEVLEHLVDPLEHIRTMAQHLRPGGLLLFSEAFGLTGDDYPSHLVRCEDAGREIRAELGRQGFTQRDVLLDRIHVYEFLPRATVIVPIFNAYDHLKVLLDSIRLVDDASLMDWLFVNDGSTDPRVLPLLQEFVATHQYARLIHRAANLGFILTCNEGIDASTGDVILLNSDTILYPSSLTQLTRTVYSAVDIGTATPLSNNASIYSIFRGVHRNNSLWQFLTTQELGAVDVPTGVGFCLYIRRTVIDSIGMFDPVYGVGYGEETDFCLRASRAGWRHVLATNAFVYHSGSVSMVAAGIIQEGETTRSDNEKIIHRRFPEFIQKVEAFYSSGAVAKLTEALEPAYAAWLMGQRKVVMFLLHHALWEETIGGTEFHVRDLIAHYGRDYVCVVTAPSSSGYSVEVFADGQATTFHVRTNLRAILSALNPAMLHVHHLRGYNLSDVKALVDWSGPVITTIHDYHSLCPQYTLLSHRGEYCGVPESNECGQCARQLLQLEFEDIVHHRGANQLLMDRANAVIFPSQSAHDVVQLALDVSGDKVMILPHPYGTEPARSRLLRPRIERVPKRGVRVGFVGYSDKHKGATLQDAICNALETRPVDFVFLGTVGPSRNNRIYTGLYKRSDVVYLLHEYEIDVVVLTSSWPETFGFTLSEAWAAGVPAVVSPFGGPSERVAKYGGGWVLDRYDLRAYVDMVQRLVDDPSLIGVAGESIRPEMWSPSWAPYDALYATLTENSALSHGSALLEWSLSRMVAPPIPAPTVSPFVRRAWQWRAKLFPVGSTRERVYMLARRRTLGY